MSFAKEAKVSNVAKTIDIKDVECFECHKKGKYALMKKKEIFVLAYIISVCSFKGLRATTTPLIDALLSIATTVHSLYLDEFILLNNVNVCEYYK